MKKLLYVLSFAVILTACQQSDSTSETDSTEFSIEFEKYTLDNGLDVILHIDRSDPIAAVAIQYHVGSNREKVGRTGFAHLFEHMLFQQSENVPQDQFFKKIQDAGGTLNGSTNSDATQYYEVVPKNALEMVFWMESDRMGYLINTVTEKAFINQQEVVQNEKRQRVDNNPYGHTGYVIDKNLFPEGHPYNWQVIGELEDLQNATVEDVKEFYNNFYGPNNATLVVAGDIDVEQTKAMIEKYFGEIKTRKEVGELEVQRVSLDKNIRLYHEDNFASAPQLTMVWPGVEEYSKDAYALDFLGQILSSGKKAPMYKVLVKDKKLTSRVGAFNRSREIAGSFRISVTANNGVDLDSIESAIYEGFELFEKEGISDVDMERVKAGLETQFYFRIGGVLIKAFQLASYNTFAGDPGFIADDIQNIKNVTKEDVMNAYNKYIKGQNYILTSFVPKGQLELAAADSEQAEIVEEQITENQEAEIAELDDTFEKTPSAFDRSIEPEKGTFPELKIPESWTSELNNGMQVLGIQQTELPLVNFSLTIDGGHMLDGFEKIGTANLVAALMQEGTVNKTPEQLEEEIDLLGASLGIRASDDAITISGSSLARNFSKVMDLVEEMVLQPRWDVEEFDRIKTSTLNSLRRRSANPNAVANDLFMKVSYGENHMMAYPVSGLPETVENISVDDLKSFYDKNFSPSISRFHIVGSISQDEALAELKDLETNWAAKEVEIPVYELPEERSQSTLMFVDIPGSKQSVINIGKMAMAQSDPDYYEAQIMNNKLGGGFNGNVNMILREEKGYTYGARTFFSGGKETGMFMASSSVRTNATFESVTIFKEEMDKYKEGISAEDLEFTKNSMIKSMVRQFESYGALQGMLSTRSKYGLPANYILERQESVRNMTHERHKELANKYLETDKMIYMVVGDAETQFSRFKDAGFNEIKLVDKEGNEIQEPVKIETDR